MNLEHNKKLFLTIVKAAKALAGVSPETDPIDFQPNSDGDTLEAKCVVGTVSFVTHIITEPSGNFQPVITSESRERRMTHSNAGSQFMGVLRYLTSGISPYDDHPVIYANIPLVFTSNSKQAKEGEEVVATMKFNAYRSIQLEPVLRGFIRALTEKLTAGHAKFYGEEDVDGQRKTLFAIELGKRLFGADSIAPGTSAITGSHDGLIVHYVKSGMAYVDAVVALFPEKADHIKARIFDELTSSRKLGKGIWQVLDPNFTSRLR